MGPPHRRAREITDAAIEALDRAGDAPSFLFLNYYDAHAPYYAPREYRDAFPGREPPPGPGVFARPRFAR